VPMMIHFPKDANNGVNHNYTGQMDVYPTLANMFNLTKNDMFGKDMMDSANQTVIFRNGSVTDGKHFYISWDNAYYDISTGEKVEETPELKEMKDNAMDELSYSDDLLNHNLLKKFNSSEK
jgi:Phosphoglycerol transferase and related proteins, alkaline phosphatase superfamily